MGELGGWEGKWYNYVINLKIYYVSGETEDIIHK